MTPVQQRLFAALKDTLPKSYSPYSNFKVAAAILDDVGGLSCGTNIENAAYPQGWCAETCAISHMIMSGGKKIIDIGVMGLGTEVCTPCGGCRQKIREFATDQTRIHVFDEASLRAEFTLEQLLPMSFGPDNLSKK
ncbi:MAG: cytidine deaminase [Alphaproteobacteria bacterium]